MNFAHNAINTAIKGVWVDLMIADPTGFVGAYIAYKMHGPEDPNDESAHENDA